MGTKSKNATSTAKSSNKLGHYIRAPFRALGRARDMYVNSLGGCAGCVQQGGAFIPSVPHSQSHGFYTSNSRNSTSTSSGDHDFQELLRAASQGRLGSLNMTNINNNFIKDPIAIVPRSQSVGVGIGIARIDEDQPLDLNDYNEENIVKGVRMVNNDDAQVMYPRSRSCAVPDKRRRVVGVLA